MKIKYSIPLLFFVFVLFTNVQSANAEIVYRNKDQKCFTAVKCGTPGSNCAETNTPFKLHRARLTLENKPIASNKVFLYECYHFAEEPGVPLCVPAPISACTDESCTLQNPSVKWTPNGNSFRASFEAICRSGIAPGATEAEIQEECANVVNAQIQAVDAKVNAIDLTYDGLYIPSGDNKTLQIINSLPSTQNLASAYEWGSYNDFIDGEELARSFVAITFSDPIQGTQGTTISDKLSMLGFKSSNTCDRVKWDPYGRVFYNDPTSVMNLEPVAGAWIGVYKSEVDPVTNASVFKLMPEIAAEGFLNPRKTSTFGNYSFLVGQGTYRLQVKASKEAFATGETLAAPDATGQIPGSLISLNASSIGTSATVNVNSKDVLLYPNIYQSKAGDPAPDIVQIDEPKRADVGITGITPKEIEILEVQQVGLPSGNHLLKGTLSKPLGRIVVTLRSSGVKVGETYANLNGEFSLTVDPVKSGAIPGDSYDFSKFATPLTLVTPAVSKIPFGKQMLNLLSMIIGKVDAVELGGIPVRMNYVKGVAYSKSGTVLKNAAVTVVDSSLGIPVYKAMTNDEGMFEVPSDKLPVGGYYFMYKSEGASSAQKVTVQEFVQANKKYLESGEVNVFMPKLSTDNPMTAPDALLTQKAQEKAAFEASNANGGNAANSSNTYSQDQNKITQNPVSPVTNPQTNTMLLVYVVILLILVVGVGILVVYYLKRKQDPHLYD